MSAKPLNSNQIPLFLTRDSICHRFNTAQGTSQLLELKSDFFISHMGRYMPSLQYCARGTASRHCSAGTSVHDGMNRRENCKIYAVHPHSSSWKR
eukprot:6193891-Pleurochrysis_carterae.AAC.2